MIWLVLLAEKHATVGDVGRALPAGDARAVVPLIQDHLPMRRRVQPVLHRIISDFPGIDTKIALQIGRLFLY